MIGQKTTRSRSPDPRAFKKQKSFTTAMRGLGLDGEFDDSVDGKLCGEERVSGLQKSRPVESESFIGSLTSTIHSRLEDFEHKVIEVITPCIRAQDSMEAPIIHEESDIKIPCTDDHLHSLGVKFSTDVDDKTPDRKKHKITAVEEQHDFVKKTKLRVGDVLHAVNGLDVSAAEHRDILDRFHQMDGQIIFILKRKIELEPDDDDDDDDDEDDGPTEVYTFIEIKIDILIDNGKIVFETIVLEREYIDKSDDGFPMVHYYDRYNTYIYPSNDSSSFVAMPDRNRLQVVAANNDFKEGQWTMYQYKVLWPYDIQNEVNPDDPDLAVVLFNQQFNKCLAVSTGRNRSLTFKKVGFVSLEKLKHVDGRVFYRRLWAKGTDRYVFESAYFRGLYLAVSGKGIMLMEQKDPENFVFNTAFSLQDIRNTVISNTI